MRPKFGTGPAGVLFLSGILFFPVPARSADDAVVPNEQLVLDGLPAIPKTLADRALPYMESRARFFQAWNPMRPEMIVTRAASWSREARTGAT